MRITLVRALGNNRRARIAFITLGFLLLGTTVLFAEAPVKKENVFKQVCSIEKRGFVNFVTTPGEFVSTFKIEKKDHPKAWPATYIPRVFTKMVTRFSSGAYDIAILPWYAPAMNDDRPLTRRFDMPDYVWQKD